MPVFVQWDNPERTIIFIRYEQWTWDDFYDALRESASMAATANHSVDIIADLADGVVPKGGTLSHAAASLKQSDEHVRLIVLVTSNRFVQSLLDMSSRILPDIKKKYRIVSSVDLARQLIAREGLG